MQVHTNISDTLHLKEYVSMADLQFLLECWLWSYHYNNTQLYIVHLEHQDLAKHRTCPSHILLGMSYLLDNIDLKSCDIITIIDNQFEKTLVHHKLYTILLMYRCRCSYLAGIDLLLVKLVQLTMIHLYNTNPYCTCL